MEPLLAQPRRGRGGRGRGAGGVAGVAVEAVREDWLVEDRWWTPKPLESRYFELALADGRNLVVFREPAEPLEGGRGSSNGRERGTRSFTPLGLSRSAMARRCLTSSPWPRPSRATRRSR